MRKITKNNPPADLVSYIKIKSETPHFYSNTMPKKAVRLALLNEQGWVCGYCQQKINDSEKTKIEHHCEYSICNGKNGRIDRRLDYTNLMVVCQGKAGYGVLHCDTNKGETHVRAKLPMNISPWETSHMAAISYSSNGLVKSSISRHNEEINEILNLNTKHLKELRRKKFVNFYRSIKSPNKNSVSAKKQLRMMLLRDIEMGNKIEIDKETKESRQLNEFPNSFPGMSQYMLDKFC